MHDDLTPQKKALRRAAALLDGQAGIAKLCGYADRRGVWVYFNTDREFPAEHCPIIERETRNLGHVVRCEELRPDVAWEVLRAQSANKKG